MSDEGGKAAAAFGALSGALGGPKRASLASQFNGCVLFDLHDAGKWTLDLRVAAGDEAGVRKGEAANGAAPDLTVSMKEAVFLKLINGDLEPGAALMNGASRACALGRGSRVKSAAESVCAESRARGCRGAQGPRQHGAGYEAGAGAARRGRGARQGEAVSAGAERCTQRLLRTGPCAPSACAPSACSLQTHTHAAVRPSRRCAASFPPRACCCACCSRVATDPATRPHASAPTRADATCRLLRSVFFVC